MLVRYQRSLTALGVWIDPKKTHQRGKIVSLFLYLSIMKEDKEKKGGFKKGNQLWKLAGDNIGRKTKYKPETLLKKAQEYFQHMDERAWNKIEFHGKDALECKIPLSPPYTFTGLYLFLGIDHKTWVNYESKDEFLPITTYVRNVIYTQKFEGASVGAYNPLIISRDLGLKEASEISVNTDKRLAVDDLFPPHWDDDDLKPKDEDE